MVAPPAPTSVRADAWTWAVRLFATRSAASAACKAGHVKVNEVSAKPSQPVRPGDVVRALTPGGERIVVVVGLIGKRTSAALAALQYEDRTPPPLPRRSASTWPAATAGQVDRPSATAGSPSASCEATPSA